MNGVGGRTIAEAKQNISCVEFAQWCQFRAARGTMHTGMRLEEVFGRWQANYFTFHSKSGQKKMADFMPHYTEAQRELSIEEAMAEWE